MIFKYLSTFRSLWFSNLPSSLPIQAFQSLSGNRVGEVSEGGERAIGGLSFWGLSSSGFERGQNPNRFPPGGH